MNPRWERLVKMVSRRTKVSLEESADALLNIIGELEDRRKRDWLAEPVEEKEKRRKEQRNRLARAGL